MRSKIYIEDMLLNKDKRLMENEHYHGAVVIYPDGSASFAEFTEHEVKVAIDRGARNLEDRPEAKSWFSKFFGNDA